MQIGVRITLASISPAPAYTGGPFATGVAILRTTAGGHIDREYFVSCDAMGERVDMVQGGNYVQLLDTTLEISNHDRWFDDFSAADASLIGATVEVGEWSGSTLNVVWTGIVADDPFQGMNIVCRVESALAARQKVIPAKAFTASGAQAIPSSYEGLPVPAIWGAIDGMAPPPQEVKSKNLIALAVNFDDDYFARDRTSVKAAASKSVFDVHSIIVDNDNGYFLMHNAEARTDLWYLHIAEGVFIDVISGTGSGQRRLIKSMYAYFNLGTDPAHFWDQNIRITVDAELDTILDNTSVVSFSLVSSGFLNIVADEAIVSGVTTLLDGKSYNIGFTNQSPDGNSWVDISGEFAIGTNYKAIQYVFPSDNYWISSTNDGKSLSSPVAVNVIGAHDSGNYPFHVDRDLLCPFKMIGSAIPASLIDSGGDVYYMASCEIPSSGYSGTYVGFNLAFVIVDIYGVTHHVCDPMASYTKFPRNLGDTANSYSPGIISDGIGGRFISQAVKITMPVELFEVRSIYAGLVLTNGLAYNCASWDFFPATVSGDTLSGITHATGAGYEAPMVGDLVYAVTDSLPGFPTNPHSYDSSVYNNTLEYRIITYVSTDTFTIKVDRPYDSTPRPVFTRVFGPGHSAQGFAVAHQYEAGIAITLGDIPPTSQFCIAASQGRKFSAAWPTLPTGVSIGDPITLARDAILDMFYRDLGLTDAQVDFAAFQALPADPIHSAMVERVSSSERAASLARQFNWVLSHDATARETATAWLGRVGSTAFDYSIDTCDIREGTLTGISISDVVDLVNLPTFKWDWTQADGFRQTSNVVDVAQDPTSLTPSNYLQYISGFGDYGTSLDIYKQLHESYQINNRSNTVEIDFQDAGGDISALLWPAVGMSRIDWIATRKPIFVLSIPDTSTAKDARVGKRVKLRHKRYARDWVYGTVADWQVDVMGACYNLTIIGDPQSLADTGLFTDTLDPTESVELYTDMIDGTSTQYIDTLGSL